MVVWQGVFPNLKAAVIGWLELFCAKMTKFIWFCFCVTHVWAAPKRKLEECMLWCPPKPEMAESLITMKAKKN